MDPSEQKTGIFGGDSGVAEGWSARGSAAGNAGAQAAGAPIEPGDVVADRYEILALLGEGGMGAVFKARDRELDRLVALKVVHPEMSRDPAVLARFKQELILARKITHKNVIRIHDLGEAHGTKFITMDFIEGDDLATILEQQHKMRPKEAVEIIEQVAYALQAAHAEGVVHRDLKPQNIMRDRQGRILVMDFGLARSSDSTQMTQSGALVGTIEFMSPEQGMGKKVDGRSDLYSLGLIFYQLLTGELPFKAESSLASLVKRTREAAPSPSASDPALPRALCRIILKCLETDPTQRYQNASEVLADLEAWKAGQRPKTAIGIKSPIASSALIVGVAVVVVVLAAVSILVTWYRLTRTPKPPHPTVVVLVGDFKNNTGDSVFDGTLEPMLNVALEGASFVNAFNRGDARALALKLPKPSNKLDEEAARLVAVSQAISAVITGEISRRGDEYSLTATAVDAVTGRVLTKAEVSAANKDGVANAIPKLAAPLRTALGDATPESVQLEHARGAFTAASLEVIHQYGLATEQEFAGKFEDALHSFAKTTELDPNFARGYFGMAAMAGNLGKPQDAEKYLKTAMEHVDHMTERERYRVRAAYYFRTGNFQKCVDEYSELLQRFPADNVVHANLATCLSVVRNLPKAVEEARRDAEIFPKDPIARANLSLFSSYAGDFQGGEREARQLQQLSPAFEYSYLTLAFAQSGQNQFAQSAATYQALGKVSALGASMAAAGLADLAIFEGRFRDAIRILEEGAAADVAGNRPDAAADKFAALAYAQLWMQRQRPAIAAANQALANSQAPKIRFRAACILVEAGEAAKAQKLAAGLASEVSSEPQAYSKIIEGKLAFRRGDARRAIESMTEANRVLDTWIGHFELGRAYLEAGAFAEADSEFDRCIKRRGETLALFLDEVPTYGYFLPVYYYQGRVREGLKSPGFVEPYRTYLSIRSQAGEDPLILDIRRRLGP